MRIISERSGSQKRHEALEQACRTSHRQLEALFNFDHLYIGGGNAEKIDFGLPAHVTRMPNEDGLLGGVMLWKEQYTIWL